MPVTVVCGGQFGSEGKGKVAHDIARSEGVSIAVRVGGSNSGHTVIDSLGRERKFRMLPTASILPNVICAISPGAYIDADVLLNEIAETGLEPDRLLIDPFAMIVSEEHKTEEAASGLRSSIGSTLSGTGAAVTARIRRDGTARFAKDDERFDAYTKRGTTDFLRERLKRDERLLIEGTQGFGLSLLHSRHYPQVTSRDTSAAGFVAEAGLSPHDVDDVVMVIRAFPIRVAGNSGELPQEIDWETLREESGYSDSIVERTTVTHKVRRVARFDSEIVRAAIACNAPTRIVLNHMDYVDAECRKTNALSDKAKAFLDWLEGDIDARVDFLGFGPAQILPYHRADYVSAALA